MDDVVILQGHEVRPFRMLLVKIHHHLILPQQRLGLDMMHGMHFRVGLSSDIPPEVEDKLHAREQLLQEKEDFWIGFLHFFESNHPISNHGTDDIDDGPS